MYQKVLVPLDGCSESELVFDKFKDDISPDAEMILLYVVPPSRTPTLSENAQSGCELQDETAFACAEAALYLENVIDRLGADPRKYRWQVLVDGSVCHGIVEFAKREDVDLVAMELSNRKGLARLIKRSISGDVWRTPVDVKAFGPGGLKYIP